MLIMGHLHPLKALAYTDAVVPPPVTEFSLLGARYDGVYR